jgi:hypothetical protein
MKYMHDNWSFRGRCCSTSSTATNEYVSDAFRYIPLSGYRVLRKHPTTPRVSLCLVPFQRYKALPRLRLDTDR